AGLSAGQTLRRCSAAGADAARVGVDRVARRRDLCRAVRWGLEDLRAGEIAWGPVPTVAAAAHESHARPLLARGEPVVLVADRGRPAGLLDRERVHVAPVEGSLASRLEASGDLSAALRLWLLRTAGRVARSLDVAVYLVGGAVRDLLMEG